MKNNNVLVIQLSRLGDFLQSTLLINSLKKNGKQVYILGDEKNSMIADEVRFLCTFLPFKIGRYIELIKKGNLLECYEDLEQFVKELNKFEFSELYNLNHSDINFFLSNMISAKRKKGFRVQNSKFVDFIYEIVKNRKDNRFNLVDIFNSFADKRTRSRSLFINRNMSAIHIKLLDKIFKGRGNIVFHLGAGHPLREWGIEKFIDLGEKIFDTFDVNITVTGGRNEKKLGKKFGEMLNSKYSNRFINLVGKTDISLLKAVLLKSVLMISTDTGVMHLAAACGTNIISLFYGSAYVYETGPYTETALILSPKRECYPCTEEHQFCDNIDCKNDISTHDVFTVAKYWLGKCNFEALKKYFSKRKNVVLYEPYFDRYGICYKNILKKKKNEKIREKGFGYA